MIRQIELVGIHTDTNPDIERYVLRKIARLDRYMPRHIRRSAHVTVRLREDGSSAKSKCSCDAQLVLPNETLQAKEATLNMFAAVDIVEEKLKQQLKKYKELHGLERRRARSLRRSVKKMLGTLESVEK